jgi:hypothetical protein
VTARRSIEPPPCGCRSMGETEAGCIPCQRAGFCPLKCEPQRKPATQRIQIGMRRDSCASVRVRGPVAKRVRTPPPHIHVTVSLHNTARPITKTATQNDAGAFLSSPRHSNPKNSSSRRKSCIMVICKAHAHRVLSARLHLLAERYSAFKTVRVGCVLHQFLIQRSIAAISTLAICEASCAARSRLTPVTNPISQDW